MTQPVSRRTLAEVCVLEHYIQMGRTVPAGQAQISTVAILAQGTSWAVAATQAFLGVGSSPGARTTLAPKHTLQ